MVMLKTKIFLYFILIIAFLIFYQSEPVYAGIIFFIIIIAIVYFKFRKNRGMGSSRFFSKGLNQMSASNDNLIFFFMMQQFLKRDSATNNNGNDNPDLIKASKEEYIDDIKEKVLNLLDNKL